MNKQKLSPALVQLEEEFMHEGPSAAMAVRSLGVVSGRAARPRALVFVHCQPDADFDELRKFDVQFNQATGSVRTAIVPLEELERVADHPAALYVTPSTAARSCIDVAASTINFPAFRRSTNLSGKGVLIAIVDTGVDWLHPDLAGRIRFVWDQTVQGQGTSIGGYSYGAQYTAPPFGAIDAEGHGTHVAGIAGGCHGVYGGIADEAEFIIVRTDMQTGHIADGVRWAASVADHLGRPLVINLSLGTHDDAHDGTDGLCRTIDAISGRGRIVCCAAGNEGNDDIHGELLLGPGQADVMPLNVPVGRIGWFGLNGWYPGATACEIALKVPGAGVTSVQGVVNDPVRSPSTRLTIGQLRIRITTPGPNPLNGDHSFRVEVTALGGTLIPSGDWELFVRNVGSSSARVHVWTLDDRGQPEVHFRGSCVRDAVKVGAPGAAGSAITVGAYTSRVHWQNGTSIHTVSLPFRDVATFSSEGPLRNGALKPDVLAPGAMIVSARSSGWSGAPPDHCVGPNHVVLSGTSMATPVITGVVACLLQRDPTLDPVTARRLLQSNCRIPGRPAGSFDPKWGAGLLDVLHL
ncbi:MAG: S8 family serine peptidase [Planctomycetota bacterium]|nr:S8 family serine peptidase [Planctomycetota bacterium]